MTPKILLLRRKDHSHLSVFLEKFLSLIPKKAELIESESQAELQEFYVKEGDPAVLLIDITPQGFAEKVPGAEFSSLFSSIRKIDPHACILMLTERFSTAKELMSWMDRGATGVISLEFHEESVSDSLKEMLEARLKVMRKSPRAPSEHSIKVKVDSTEQAIVAETINIGNGGLFVSVLVEGAQVGDLISFEFVKGKDLSVHLQSEPKDPHVSRMNSDDGAKEAASSILKGQGRITWIRQHDERELPRGMGIEFVELSKHTQEWVSDYVKNRRIAAFIPKS